MTIICTQCKVNKSLTEYYPRHNRPGISYVRECKACFKKRLSDNRRKRKDTLVKEFGGCCQRCGYSRCNRALSFHHKNNDLKEFAISAMATARIEVLRKEATKCMLLCHNCHMEHHAGIW